MEKEQRIGYWLKRFDTDSQSLTDINKLGLARALFVDFYDLKGDDINFFFDRNLVPTAQDPEMALKFSRIEQQVGISFDSGTSGWDEERYQERNERFLGSFRTTLKDFYTEKELDELLSCAGKHEQGLLVMLLLGGNHFMQRRIRSAYLPMITSLIEVGGRGDITYTLFDGKEDAVDQVDRLVLGDSAER